jgi:hypothetical protein
MAEDTGKTPKSLELGYDVPVSILDIIDWQGGVKYKAAERDAYLKAKGHKK